MPFWGNPRKTITAINMTGGIVASRMSGQTPAFAHLSASAITASGSTNPYEDLEFRWDFGDPNCTDYFTDTNGLRRNANIQYGPEAAKPYRTAGTFPITLRARGKNGNAYTIGSTSLDFTATDFSASGGTYHFASDGNDANDGLTEGAPKQSLSALVSLLGNNRKFKLRRGSHWTGTENLNLSGSALSAIRVEAYGTGANPKIEVTSGSNAPIHSQNGTASNSRPKSDIVFSNIDTLASVVGSRAMFFASSSHATATNTDIYFDNCTFEGVAGADPSPEVVGFNNSNNVDTQREGLWNCSIIDPVENFSDVSNDRHQGLSVGTRHWWFMYGTNITGGGPFKQTTFDHHVYAHVISHSVWKWNDFGPAVNRSYCLNMDCGEAIGEGDGYADYHLISENTFRGALRAWDASNGQNDPTTSRFRNFIGERNRMSGLTGSGTILFYCASSMTVRYNEVWGCENGNWFLPNSAVSNPHALDDILEASIYGNKIYRTSGSGSLISFGTFTHQWTKPQQITDNVFVDLRSAASFIALRASDQIAAGSLIDGNQYWAPNDTTPFTEDGSGKSFAQWQALGLDTNGLNSDPGWIDPANGVFSVPAGRVTFGLVGT